MKRSYWILGITAVLALTLGLYAAGGPPGTSKSQAKSATEVAVNINNFKFGPASLAVSAGTKVTWTNRDEEPHTVVSAAKIFASPALDTNDKFSYTFTKPGTYTYYCSIHPYMTATVVVR